MINARLHYKLLAIKKKAQAVYAEVINDVGRNIYEVITTIQDALVEEQILLWHSVRAHKVEANASGYLTTVRLKLTFIDIKEGEEASLTSYGDGYDAQDAGTTKAVSQAYIDTLMTMFTNYACQYS